MEAAKTTTEYNIKDFTKSDYPLVVSWWSQQGWPAIPTIMLPKTGKLACHKGEPVAAGWIYQSDAGVTWMEWIVADPKADKEVRSQCLDNLIDSLLTWAKDNGYQGVFTTTEHEGLIERYKKHGFDVQQDGNMTNMIWSRT